MKDKKWSRRVAALALGASIAVMGVSGGTALAAPNDSTCDLSAAVSTNKGTVANPYLVGTAAQLQELSDCSAAGYSYYKITANIVLTPGTDDWNKTDNGGWKPIGDGSHFEGVVDGNGKIISGLTIDRLGSDYQGLFNDVENSMVFNLTVAGTVKGGSSTGGLAGYIQTSTVRNVTVSVTVTGDGSNVGGVAGYIYHSNFDTVTNTGEVLIDNSVQNTLKRYYGGICGDCEYSNLSNITSKGKVTGVRLVSGSNYSTTRYVGGVAGELYYGSLDSATSSGAVIGDYYVGGLVGYTEYASGITNSSSSSSVRAASIGQDSSYVGGAIGYNDYVPVQNVSTSGAVTGIKYVGGVVGYADYAEMANISSSGAITFNRSLNSGTPYPDYFGGLVGELDYGAIYGGTTKGTIVCSFEYCEDGGGAVGYVYYALVSGVSSSRSISVDASSGNSGYAIGGLVGYCYYGSIVKSSASGAVTTKNAYYVGGLAGYAEYTLIRKSSSSGAVSATMDSGDHSDLQAGGLLGGVEGAISITQSSTTSNVTATGTGAIGVGGFIGKFTSSSYLNIRDSFARSNVKGTDYVAGIVGQATDRTSTMLVKNVYLTGTITTAGTHKDAIISKDADTHAKLAGVLFVNGTAAAANSVGAVRKTATQLKSLSTYTAAGFSKLTWGVNAKKNGGFAYLK